MAGTTCAQAKAQGACKFLALSGADKLCGCSCAGNGAAPAHAHQRQRALFGTIASEASGCNTEKFHARLLAVQRQCCQGNATCVDIPTDCDFSCSRAAPSFYSDCYTTLTRLAPDKVGAVAALVQTCSRIPAQAMIDAIASATCTERMTTMS